MWRIACCFQIMHNFDHMVPLGRIFAVTNYEHNEVFCKARVRVTSQHKGYCEFMVGVMCLMLRCISGS